MPLEYTVFSFSFVILIVLVFLGKQYNKAMAEQLANLEDRLRVIEKQVL